MKFSKKVEYALIALVYMTRKPKGELTTARELADKFDISLELIGKLLQKLGREEIIVSTQGVKGGYELNRAPGDINIKLIIQAIDGPMYSTTCTNIDAAEPCVREEYCIIKDTMGDIHTQVQSLFDNISLKEFMNKKKTG